MTERPIVVRAARAAEYPVIGELTVRAFAADGFADEDYRPILRDVAARAAVAEVLVAEEAGRILGSVTSVTGGGPYAEQAGDGEAVFRMLAVDPQLRGRGAARLLVRSCVERARGAGCRRLVISTRPGMRAAHRLYEQEGFRRCPERDWEPLPGLELWCYALELAGPGGRGGSPSSASAASMSSRETPSRNSTASR